ncbi:MAG: T9SS type A sorting domain-containing protein [Bacteroidales bacterium]|jgi:hypothetical protein|nr:T9SS type A sorting domain-containing protein [Bacteroidales bacterium]
MRPISFLLFLILVSNTIHPQQLSVKSFGCYGGSETDYITNSIMTRDSSVYIVLRSFSQDRDVGYAPAESKAWIVKCNLAGDTIWTRSYYISSENYLYTIRELPGGNLILAGLAPFDYKIGEGLWIVVIDPDGNLLKSTLYDNNGHTAAWDIRICDDDSFILAGETLDESVPGFHKNGANEDIIVQKMDSDFNITWSKAFGGSGADIGRFIFPTNNGGFVLFGNVVSDNGDVEDNHGTGMNTNDIWAAKINSSGEIEHQNCIGGSWHERLSSVILTLDKGYLLIGNTTSDDGDVIGFCESGFVPGLEDLFIAKLDSSLNTQWAKAYGGFDKDYGHSGYQDKDGSFFIIGSNGADGCWVDDNHGYSDWWFCRIGKNGEMVFKQSMGTDKTDYGNYMYRSGSNKLLSMGVVPSGIFIDGGLTDFDLFLLSLEFISEIPDTGDSTIITNPDSTVITTPDSTIITNPDSTLTTNPDIVNIDMRIYPNPARELITIDHPAFLEIRLYDMNGREMIYSKQKYVDISMLSRGMYIARIYSLDHTFRLVKLLIE